MRDTKIRQIGDMDYEEWSALWRAYLAFYKTDLPQSRHQQAFADLLNPDPTGFRGFVAEAEGRLVGLVHYVFHPHLWRAEGVCYLQDLFSAPDARGKGVGRALIEAVYAAADRAGVPRVYWTTQEFNYAGRMLYDQVGRKTPFIKYERPA